MTKTTKPADTTATKAAAHEAIGKLIGDDDAVAAGRAEKAAATQPDPDRKAKDKPKD